MEAVENTEDLFRLEENRSLVRYLVQRCASVNEGENLSLDIGNVELRIIPGDSVEIPHITPAVDALVVFAGSNDLWDWIQNAACLKRACAANGGRVHCGFESDFMRVKDTLLERLSGAHRVGIAGHSRAHPLACRLAEELHNAGAEVSFVITFGGPRWCDLDRRDRYNARRIPTYRFVVGWDAVPRWPKFGYKHVGKMICLSRAGKVLPRQQHPSWWTPWRFLWNAADEHIVANEYTRAVRDWRGQP